ncbi:MAG: DUF1648 domain-containing protein [Phycisphaerae bacterium]|nr:DUF1648 domain-containing protein [Phycisphaerae bacterium]
MARMAMRVVLGLVGCALVFLWTWLLVEFGRLPALIPTHFDGAGVPDRWSETTALAWFGPHLIGLFVVCTLVGTAFLIRWMARRHPGLVNIPNKDKWVQLPTDARVWSIEPIALALAASGVLVTGVFGVIAWSTSAVGSGQLTAAPIWPIWALIGLLLASVIGSIAFVTARVHAACRTLGGSP